ncbi:Cytochrome c oxidase assembly protein cox15 [Clydaea vesicula]|uniref:Cytochrome c oxidase assembly protein cox15 n=1 Tax=Clydaea vesicula TaxID=447962 RepID=A0AAD5U6A3_9FUNG|nr:Cytochrome c oxidase assembly protein cox15 [Clydaea vesicula]
MLSNPMLKPFRTYTHATTGLIFFTAMSGAFVAGLDAGLIYNEFPYMGNSLIPSDMWAISDGSTLGVDPKPWYLNFLENPATVQFDHRVLAMLTATSVFSLWVYARKLKLPKNARYAVNSLLGVCILQVSLGISTLIWLVPVPLAAAHQAGSLTLLSTALWLMHTLKRIK